MELRQTALPIPVRDGESEGALVFLEVRLSLVERLVLLHVGSTAVLLVLLGVVMVVRNVFDHFVARRADRAVRAPAPAGQTQVVRAHQPRAVDALRTQSPRVEGAVRRAS